MKLEIDCEVADKITLLNLLDCFKRIDLELKNYEDGEWLHPEDVSQNIKVAKALKVVIQYFGGEV
jgi:hypothetical protein